MNSTTQTDTQPSGAYETTRRILLAFVGAAAIVAEELTEIVNRLAVRGEQADAEFKRRSAEIKEERAKAARANEVDALNNRLTELQAELEMLKREQPAEGADGS